ncbi:MAG TPA: AraC family transcriptional regulator [Bryobacteraceae bacterium]|nr:AraC family transcriptional regulator [Bryobacteraceae bacterium]
MPDLSGGGVPKSFRQFLKWLCGNTLSIHFPKGRHAEVEWLLDRVMREDRSRPELFWTSVRLMLDEFLLLCYRQWAYKESETEKVYTSVESVVHTLRDYIDAHYREKIGLKRLSDRSGYAPSYLSSTFHKVTGQCVVEYITHKRMEHAKHLLATSGLKVVEVCLASGFNDLAHFNRMFRRIVGVTPSEFRHGPSMHQSPSVLELPPRQTAARPEPVKTGLRQFYVPVTTGRTWETTIAC